MKMLFVGILIILAFQSVHANECDRIRVEISDKTSELMRAKSNNREDEIIIIRMDLEALKQYYYESCLED